jgi:hypothetical protein
VIHRSHASNHRLRGPQPAPAARSTGVLALQRMAGNRAVRALLARSAVAIIGTERVHYSSKAEREDAERIIKEMKSKYGVTFDSIAAQATTRKHTSDRGEGTEATLKAVDRAPWEYEELKAIERALKYFGPVLGDARKQSSRASTPQEITTVGRLNTAPDDDPAKPEDSTRGQYFPEAQTFAFFNPGPETDTSPAAMEQKAVHEIAHGVFEPQLEAFMKMTGYWKQKYVRSRDKQAEGPPDGYGDENAGEDLAQSVMYFFTDPERLKQGRPGRTQGTWGNPCPRRFEWIKNIVGGWTPKPRH